MPAETSANLRNATNKDHENRWSPVARTILFEALLLNICEWLESLAGTCFGMKRPSHGSPFLKANHGVFSGVPRF